MVMNWSFWEKDTWWENLDVLIVGAGITGLSTAISLKEAKPRLRIAVVDRNTWTGGASTRNAGFACFGSPTELLANEKQMGRDAMLQLVERRYQGLLLLRTRIGDAALRFAPCGGHEIFLAEDGPAYQECLGALDGLNQGLKDILPYSPAFFPSKPGLGWAWGDAKLISAPAEGRIHPGRMVEALATMATSKGVLVATGVKVSRWWDADDHVKVVIGEGNEVSVGQLILTTNGFTPELFPQLPVQPGRNQVLITTPIGGLTWDGCFHYQQGYGYLRRVGDRVLIGGFRHLDRERESTGVLGENEDLINHMKAWLSENILPARGWEVEMTWSGILGLGDTPAPLLGHVSNRVIAAVRLGGMGVALGSLLGQGAAMLALEKELLFPDWYFGASSLS
jgi:hypothetical protein